MLLGVSKTLQMHLSRELGDALEGAVVLRSLLEIASTSPGLDDPGSSQDIALVLLDIQASPVHLKANFVRPEATPPHTLELRYLVTCLDPSPEKSQRTLWAVVEAFQQVRVLVPPELKAELPDVQAVTAVLCDSSLEERLRIWTALKRPLSLALYYRVTWQPAG